MKKAYFYAYLYTIMYKNCAKITKKDQNTNKKLCFKKYKLYKNHETWAKY